MNVLVGFSGLWLNKKYVHLAASPDGLVFHDKKFINVIEVKCLNILVSSIPVLWLSSVVNA